MRVLPLVFSVLLIWLAASPAFAQSRHALVVGIDAYDHVEDLQKARNDARSVHAALEEAGFEADLLLDTAGMALLQGLERFAARIEPGDEAVFFYAGHGVELSGENFLLPADIPAPERGGKLLIRRFALPVQDVLDTIQSKGARVALLMLDACRDNPFPRQGTRSLGGTRGLARMSAPEGAYIMYSAGAGQAALDRLSNDDPNPNSVFTRALLPRLTEPGLRLRNMVMQVRSEVRQLASRVGHNQFPAVYDQLDGSFQFIPAAMTPVPDQAQSRNTCAAAQSVWAAIRGSEDEASLEAFAASYAVTCPSIAAETRARLEELAGRRKEKLVNDCKRAIDKLGPETVNASIVTCKKAIKISPDNAGLMHDLAKALNDKTDHAGEAARWYRSAAEAGNSLGMYNLGNSYFFGDGVEQDMMEAFKWHGKAADAGLPQAMHSLATLYSIGAGVEKDLEKSVIWFQKAAEAGEANAMFALGEAYSFGRGADQDQAQATKWYRKAAEAGEVNAMNALGDAYYLGRGVDQNRIKGFKWFEKAANKGSRRAMYSIGAIFNNLGGVSEFQGGAKAARSFMQSLRGSDKMLSAFKRDSKGLKASTLREIQRILKDAGVYSGALDGAYGPQTEAALEAYSRVD